MSNPLILIIEDDPNILTGLIDLLESENYETQSATDGQKGYDTFLTQRPDLILLDVMLPSIHGYDLCKMIRQEDETIPIMMLTAKGQEIDKVVGLESGADDYMVKPFGVNELLARIRRLIKRCSQNVSKEEKFHPICFKNFQIYPSNLKGYKNNEEFTMTLREAQLIHYLYENKSKTLSREDLLNYVWGVKYFGTTRTLDQHIAQLRKKIEDNPSKPKHILTVHGVGYRFTP